MNEKDKPQNDKGIMSDDQIQQLIEETNQPKEIKIASCFLPLKSEEIVETFEQATAKIVNMEVTRQVNYQKFIQQTQMN